jgi:hypothetical protein
MEIYEIVVEDRGPLDWSNWFDPLSLEPLPDGKVRLRVSFPDQPALHGLLERIRDLNLVIVSVQRME